MRQPRDRIDFAKENIPRLFLRLFVPTLLGLLFGAMLNIADGIFVGRGVGSDALAAVNVAAPIFLFATGTALLFGSGVSVVVAIHMSHGNFKAANINVTQAFTISTTLMLLVALLIVCFPIPTIHIFGGEGRIVPLARDYLLAVTPVLVLTQVLLIGMFVIRLDGAPKFAMAANITASLLNIILDWLFVFPFHWGIRGAAVASSMAQAVGALMIVVYLCAFSKRLHFYRPKFSRKSLLLTARNAVYMMRVGLPSFIGEIAMSVMIITGNYTFMPRLHEDGVAAYSVCCYLFPLVFMFGNAIAQSSLPIISYNYGSGDTVRIRKTFRLSLSLAFGLGLLMTLGGLFFAGPLVSLFLQPGTAAWAICEEGLPLFSLSYVFFTMNVVLVGYLQSLERSRAATFFMLLRSCILLIPSFLLLPPLVGNDGLWLAVPLSEMLTAGCIGVVLVWRRRKDRRPTPGPSLRREGRK